MNTVSDSSCRRLSSFHLKLLALVTMTIDHTAAVLRCGDFYRLMRNVGRAAFPIYCFLLVEGFFHTRNLKNYLGRLALLAVLSEVPFNLALYRQWPHPKSNVMLTLFLGLLTVAILDRGREQLRRQEPTVPARESLWLFGVTCVGMGTAFQLQTDYRGGGVLLIVLFYLFREDRQPLLVLLPPLLLVFYNAYELWGLLALLPIACYSGKRGFSGGKAGQWFFYLYYPIHLTVLVVLRAVLLGTSVSFAGLVFP